MAEEKTTVKKAATKKAAAKKAAVKKAPAKKAMAKKVATKKPVTETEAAVEKTPVAEKKVAPASEADSGVKKVSITLVRSKHGRLKSHQACVAGLGLRRMHQTVQVIDTPENRGMINKIQYMLNIEEA